MHKLAALLILFAGSAMAQIPTPQVPLTMARRRSAETSHSSTLAQSICQPTPILTLTFPNTNRHLAHSLH